MIRILTLLLSLSCATAIHAAPNDNKDGFWSEWSEATFERAAHEKKFGRPADPISCLPR